ncbi:CopG family transcriptional regulator [Corynebacterium sp. ES2794-CONJ1]|uniref:CopG family transcriptional regulator n=1 Tax=unclassified Corynebacterium TaxID=2624378 RepID=UPI00216946A9|nr:MULTISPECIES: CopG family transcriptional regulator [unclassified Corynebacterium]MCS4490443.1 CopG family transcriptional regulator [Corynebacterium sp. ES2775-CONJ]MCS4492223.1 CopG family transcriptional regulator [Corynebacterium sp. ES2715-CONJ3]MCS4532293.1 CopG family transcriptional regulator [Corynebacterium sp. ES2730-CONJ]MCU9519742.1 CopG family transcriptional regulator [Corynebacterium sp. ES2794-CONJ1]
MAMTLRLTPEYNRAVELLAQAQGVSKHEAVLRAIMAQARRSVNDSLIESLATDLIENHYMEDRLNRARREHH